ncbi:MAG: LamG-like jellyroll fold domain-containing protein [Bacteroidia bacterium]
MKTQLLGLFSFAMLSCSTVLAQLESDPNLIAYYKFDGNADDASSNGFDATLVGESAYVADRFGNPNSAFSFNGSSNYFLIENTTSVFKPTTFPVTVSAWLKIPSDFTGQFTFFKNDYAQNIYSGIRGTVIPSGLVTIGLENGGPIATQSRKTKTGTTNIKDGEWHLVTCIIRGFSNMDIYIDCANDGGSYSGGATTLSYNPSNPGVFGAYDGVLGNTGLDYSKGEIDELIFIGRELTYAEIVSQLGVPQAEITGNTTLCPGSTTTLTAHGGTSYQWNEGQTTQSIDVSEPGLYSVVVTGAGQCSSSAEVEVISGSNPQLTISANGPTSFCEGGSVELSVNSSGSFTWNDGGSDNPRMVNASGVYSVSTEEGCGAASNSIEVHVWSNPDVPTINPSGIVNIDQGSSVMLMSSPAVSYEWIPGGQTTQSINVNSSGAYSVRVFNEHGCSAVSSATTVNVNPVIEPPVPGTCTAVEVIEYLPAKQNDGTNLPASRMISTNALGAPQNSDLTTGEANYNFVSLGFGGSITVRMSGAIANGDGNDIRVTETTFGSMSGNCVRYPETILAFASQDNCNWVYLGSGCQDAEFDLGELNWAEYIRLVDVSPLSSNYNGGIADGYDVDGIECLHGTIDNPEMQDLGNSYAMSYVSSAQGPRQNGTPVAASRSDENQALGAPQNTNTVNFFSLGFGGNIVLKLGYAIFDKPGADIEVVETSYGNPACASYREEAMVEVSLDGSNWIDLGIICLDGSVDLSTGGAIAASYVRITDHSAASNFGSTGDAYDLDGIIVLQPGCSASNPTAQKLEDISSPDEIANIDLVQSVTKNNFNMNISVEKPEVMNIIVTSLMGQQISARSLEVNGYAVQNIDLAGLSAGVYLISARSASVNETFKVFVK